MLGDSVMINDGVLGTHSPPTTSDLMFDGNCRWKLKFSCKPMRAHAYSCGYGLPSTLCFPQVSCPKPPSSGMTTDWNALEACLEAAQRKPHCVLKIVVFDDADYSYAQTAAA